MQMVRRQRGLHGRQCFCSSWGVALLRCRDFREGWDLSAQSCTCAAWALGEAGVPGPLGARYGVSKWRGLSPDAECLEGCIFERVVLVSSRKDVTFCEERDVHTKDLLVPLRITSTTTRPKSLLLPEPFLVQLEWTLLSLGRGSVLITAVLC